MKKYHLIFAMILVFSLLLAACGPAADGNGGTPGAEGVGGPATQPAGGDAAPGEGDMGVETPAGGAEGELPETGGLADDDTVGFAVMGSDGTEIGTVEDEIDAMGREYSVISVDSQFVPVPSDALISEGQIVTFTGDPAVLSAAPSFASVEEIDPQSAMWMDVETYWAGEGY